MLKKHLFFSVIILASLVLGIQNAHTNLNQPPAGNTGAPGDGTCANNGCHGGNPITGSPLFFITIVGAPTAYHVNQQYSVVVTLSASAARRGFELTALDVNNNPIGTLILVNPANTHTTLSTGANGRQYVGHDSTGSVNGIGAWSFKWQAPSSYLGPVTFYAAGLQADGNGLATNDQTYLVSKTLAAFGTASSAIANFTASPNPVCLGQSVTFTNTSSGNVASYSWNFGNGATPSTAFTAGPFTVTYNSTGPRIASLTVTDSSGQATTKNDSIVVGIPPTPTITPSAQSVCPGSSATLSCSAGSHYLWSTGDTTQTIHVSPTQSNSYTVTVSNGPGCSGSATATVNLRQPPTASAGSNINACVGDTVSTTATGGVSYRWNTGDTTATIKKVLPIVGTFPASVTVTDGFGCTASSGITVTSNALPIVNVPDQSLCGVSTTTLDAGNPGAHYAWSTHDTTKTITVTQSGTYSVTVTNSNGCKAKDTARVDFSPNLVVQQGTYNICQGQVDTLDAGHPGSNYHWSSGDTTQKIVKSLAGIYTVTVSIGSCTGTGSDTLFVNQLPQVSAGNDTAICQGNSVAIGMQPIGNTRYSWSPTTGLSNPNNAQTIATPTATTKYYLRANSNGCQSTDSVTITINTVPSVSFTGLNAAYCTSDNNGYPLTGVPTGGSFSGPGMDANDFFPGDANIGVNQIIYSYTSGSGCAANDTQFVNVHALPTPSINGLPNQTCIHGGVVTLTLTPSGGTLSGPGASGVKFDPSLTTGGPITLTYTYADSIGCAGFATAHDTVINVVVSAYGLNNTYCSSDSNSYTIYGSRSGGSFSGTGVSGNNFTPSNAGAGIAPIVYSFDTLGCTFTDTIFVTVSGIKLNTQDTTLCLGNSITLIATGATIYTWSNGSTDSSITVSPTILATYTVTGLDSSNCNATNVVTVNVIPSPTVSFTGLASSYCSNDSAVTLIGSPSGGSYTGNGILGNNFVPSIAPIGGPYPITYHYTNQYGCTDSSANYTKVLLAPTATISNIDSFYCLDAIPVTLQSSPPGGYYTGDGISGSTFVPYYAGVGLHTLYYRAAVTGSCDASLSVNILVRALPQVSLDTIPAYFCNNADTIRLQGLPADGIYSGPGVAGHYFYPATLPVGGPVIVQYSFTDIFGCTGTDYRYTEIKAVPKIQLNGIANGYCSNQIPVTLSALPSGGTFSGTGITGNQLTPSIVGAGQSQLTYSFSDSFGCIGTATTQITVNSPTAATINNLDSVYCYGIDPIRLDASPNGGYFTGLGITGNVFDVSAAGSGGPYNISYIYTDVNGCIDTTTKTVTINSLANITLSGLDSIYCLDQNNNYKIHTSPQGGTFIGAGIVDSTFNPTLAGLGNHIIVYQYGTGTGCVSYATKNVKVRACRDGIDESSLIGKVEVYPNPTNGLLNIQLSGFEPNSSLSIRLYDIEGNIINNLQLNNIATNAQYVFDLSNIAKGVYLLKLENNSGVDIRRIIVQ